MVPLEEDIETENYDGSASEIWYMQLDLRMLWTEYGFEVWDYNGRKALQMKPNLRMIPLTSILQVVLKAENHHQAYSYWCLYRVEDLERRVEKDNIWFLGSLSSKGEGHKATNKKFFHGLYSIVRSRGSRATTRKPAFKAISNSLDN